MATVSQVTEAVYRSRFDDQMTAGANAAAAAMDKLATAVEATEERVTRSERSATSWVRANDAVTQAATRAQKAKTDLANAEKALANDLAAGGEKAEAAARALDNLRTKAEQAEVRAKALAASFAAAGTASSTYNAHVAAFASANDNVGGSFGRLGPQIQNASFQLADFSVQVASGGSYVTALAQQLPQLLGAFGVFGALSGAAVAVGSMAYNLLGAADASKQFQGALEGQQAAYSAAEAAAKQRRSGLDDEAQKIIDLTAYYNSLTEVQRRGELVVLNQQRSRLEQTGRTQSLGIGTTVRDRVNNPTYGIAPGDMIGDAGISALGAVPATVEQAAAALAQLDDASNRTREGIRSVIAQMDEAARGGGSFSSAIASARDEVIRLAPELEKNGDAIRQVNQQIEAAGGPLAGMGSAAQTTAGQVQALSGALATAVQRLNELRNRAIDAPFADVNASVANLNQRLAALRGPGGLDALERVTSEQERQATITSRVAQMTETYAEALKKAGAQGADLAQQTREYGELATVNVTREVDATRTLAAERRKAEDARAAARAAEAAGRADARRESAEARRDAEAELRLENEIYAAARRTSSGLDSYGRGDDIAIRFAQANIKRAGLDPDDIEKAAKEAQRVADAAYKTQQRQAEATFDRISDYAGNAFADVFLNTEGGWKRTMANLERVAIATFAKIAFEAAARPIIMPVVQAFTGSSAVGTAASIAGQASGATSATSLAGGGTSLIGYGRQVSGLFDSSFFGGSQNFQSGFIGTADRYFNTNVAGFLDRPLYTVGGEAIPVGADPIAASYAQPGVDVSIGQAAGGALGVAGGLYGIYSGIQTGGAKGWAQGASGAAATAGGAAILAGGSAAGGVIAATAAWAPYIAAIAALVAMFLPGQKPSDKTGTALLNTATGDMLAGGLSGDRYSQENRDAAASMADTVKQFASQVSSSYGITPYGQYIVGVGARDGMFWQTSERHDYGSDEASAQQMMRDITRDLLENNAWQLQGNLRTTYNTVGTGDIDRLLQALDWTNTTYKAFQDNIDPEKPTQFAQSLGQISEAYGPLIDKAREYGLAIEPIADVMQEQIDKLVAARNAQFNQTVVGMQLTSAQLRGNIDQTLGIQVQQFDLQRNIDWTALVDQVREAGLGEAQLEVARAAFDEMKDLQRQAIMDQSAAAKAQQAAAEAQQEAAAAQEETTRLTAQQTALEGLARQGGILSSFLDQQALGDTVSPQNAFLAAQDQYSRALEAARRDGAMDADLGAVTSAAGSLLNASSAFYGDGSQAAMIRSGVLSQVQALGGTLGLGGFTDQIDVSVSRWVAASTDTTAALQRLTDRVDALYEELRTARFMRAA
ncbi:hypothetical protein [Roseomonas chloroacetimidivorans]|uniref:hypothetical protein n=1 Tax=Roseomonas chloroacetimidivorans TaxID=1766656 RepID=UPI003C7756B7